MAEFVMGKTKMAPSDAAVIGSVQPEPESKAPKLPLCEPAGIMDDVSDILRRIENLRERKLFVLAPGPIDDLTCDEVYRWRAEFKEAGDSTGLDILIHSPGGVLTSCYQVARLFASRLDSWEALIPDLAASGATLIALGSARIIMADRAQLGPIDPQVSSKRHEKLFASERQSPLEAFEAVKYLRQFALTSVISSWRFLLEHRIAPKPALDAANNLAFHLVQPILQKIEPYDLGAFALDSGLSLQYCQRIGNPSNTSKQTQRNVPYHKLVEEYPAHEFVIDREEAKALKFEVEEPSEELDTLFEELRPYLARLDRYIGFVPPKEEKVNET